MLNSSLVTSLSFCSQTHTRVTKLLCYSCAAGKSNLVVFSLVCVLNGIRTETQTCDKSSLKRESVK